MILKHCFVEARLDDKLLQLTVLLRDLLQLPDLLRLEPVNGFFQR
jgi:hypothetical protein